MIKFIYPLIIGLACALNMHAQTGIPTTHYNHCDNLVNQFLKKHDIPGATMAISYKGELKYLRAFGFADTAKTVPTQPYHLFRIASVSKPITSIAIHKLIEDGMLSYNDTVFGSNGILANHPRFSTANITDTRIYNITVQQLLEHTAGWDRNVNCFPNPTSPYPYFFSGCDPIVAPLHVTEVLGVSNPVDEEDLIQFILEKGFDFNPGSKYAYSNMGYLILGNIIEELSGKSYQGYVQSEILSPNGICDMELGHNLPKDFHEREGMYTGNGYTTLSSYGTGNYVPWEYGGFNIEAMSAHGGWIATARDLVRLLSLVDGYPSVPDILQSSTINNMATASSVSSYAKGWQVNASNNWWHTGGLDGTASLLVRTSGEYLWAVILNKRQPNNNFWTDLDNLPWNCVLNVGTNPNHDLMHMPTIAAYDMSGVQIGADEVSLSWARGNGDQMLIVGVEDTFTYFPLDGVDYNASAKFGQGDDLGVGHFIVYNGNSNQVTVNGLEEGKNYRFRIFEYNQSAETGNNALYKLCSAPEASITMSSVGLNKTERNDLSVYPTVISDVVNISSSTNPARLDVKIRSISGQLVYQMSHQQFPTSIDLSQLPEGFYILSTDQNERKQHFRLVKQ